MSKKTVFGATTQILAIVDDYDALPVQVDNTGLTADKYGRTIIPAGTPVGGAKSYKDDPAAVLSVVNDSTAQGVLLHDTDVTEGTGNGSLLVRGFVNLNRLNGVTIADAVKTALDGKVEFLNR